MTAHRLLRLSVLLAWAVDFVELHTDTLEECHRDGNGDVYPEDVAIDIADARRWLAEAREAVK